jgi:hypothetical protein
MSKGWRREDYHQVYWNGDHQGEGKRGRLKLTWVEGIRGLMAEKGLQEGDWTDRNNWRRKIA